MFEKVKIKVSGTLRAGEHRAKDIVVEGLERIPGALYAVVVQATNGKTYEVELPEEADSIPVEANMVPTNGVMKVMLKYKTAAGDVLAKSYTEEFKAEKALTTGEKTLPTYETVKTLADRVLEVPGKIEELANDAVASAASGLSQEVAIERARIDSIIALPEGSTTGDAELADGRIGYNGVKYPNIGEAMREQFKSTLSSYSGMLRGVISMPGTDFHDLTVPGIHSFRSVDLVNMLNAPTAYSGNLIVLKGQLNFSTVQHVYITGVGAIYFECLTSSGWSSWEDITAIGEIKAARKAADGTTYPSLAKAIQSQIAGVTLTHGNIEDDADLDDYNMLGYWHIRAAQTTGIKHVPDKHGGVFIVNASLNGLALTFFQQYITTECVMYLRYKSSEGWGEWVKINSTSLCLNSRNSRIMHNNARKTLGLRWTPARANLPKTVAGSTDTYFDIEEQSGVPYSSMIMSGGDIFYNRSFETLLSAIENPTSILYTSSHFNGSNRSCAYGGVCSTYVSWITGQEIYRTTSWMNQNLEFFEVVDLDGDIDCGDILLSDGHIMIISDIVYLNNKLKSIWVTHQNLPITAQKEYSAEAFERLLKQNGGDYRLCKMAAYKPKSIKIRPHATDIYLDRGNNTWYLSSDDIWAYIPDSSVTAVKYKLQSAGSFETAVLSNLPTKTVNGHAVYNLKSLLSAAGDYYLTTNEAAEVFCELAVVSCGTISVNDASHTFSISGLSANCKPSWFGVVGAKTTSGEVDEIAADNVPPGYVGYMLEDSKAMVENVAQQSFKPLSELTDTYTKGYYIKAYFKTPYGLAVANSNYISKS